MARVVNLTRQKILGSNIRLAKDFGNRLRGLLGRSGWDDLDGLWIEPCTGVHSFWMRFPIDVILVDRFHSTLVAQTLKPWRLGKIHLEAHAALELPQGKIRETDTNIGDVLVLQDEDP